MVSPGQVITDVNPEETEVADSLHRSCVYGEGGVHLPTVHDQLLCFADVEMEVVFLAPRCQGSDLLFVGHLIVAGNPAYDCCVISKFADGVGAVGGHAVMYEQEVQERTEHAALGGAGVECQVGGCGAAYPHSLGSARQEVQDPITDGGVEPKVSELGDRLQGHDGIEF